MSDNTPTRMHEPDPETASQVPLTEGQSESIVEQHFEVDGIELHENQRIGIQVDPKPIAIIHGPPGTGKSTVSGLSITQELLTAAQPRRVLLFGPTTRAVHEVYHAFTEAWTKLAPAVGRSAGWSTQVRGRLLTGSSSESLDIPSAPQVLDHEEVNYRDLKKASELGEALTDRPLQRPTVIAGTPGKVDKLVSQMNGGGNVPRWDTVLCDEASMIDVGKLALATGPLAPFDYDQNNGTGRLYLVGDHRQLPVIRKADWESIRRPGTARHHPQAPALNLIRYLYGHDVEFKTPSKGSQRGRGANTITYIPLERSYRMHAVIAEHLQAVYRNDDLEFHSEETATLDSRWGPAPTSGLRTATLPGPLTVITHGDDRGGQSNPTEADLVAGLASYFESRWPNKTIGVVTPHNAQQSLVKRLCGDSVDAVDTVNGFQGSGKDILLASMTVGSESVQEDEGAWLLDHRRLNVALSRAREKLLVIIPQTLLEFQPSELSTYRDLQILAQMERNVREKAISTPSHATTETDVRSMVKPIYSPLQSHGSTIVNVYTHPDTYSY